MNPARAARSRFFSTHFAYMPQGASAINRTMSCRLEPLPKKARLHGLSGKLQAGRLAAYADPLLGCLLWAQNGSP